MALNTTDPGKTVVLGIGMEGNLIGCVRALKKTRIPLEESKIIFYDSGCQRREALPTPSANKQLTRPTQFPFDAKCVVAWYRECLHIVGLTRKGAMTGAGATRTHIGAKRGEKIYTFCV